jgi:hypothetical protein
MEDDNYSRTAAGGHRESWTQGELAEKEGRCGRIEPVVQPAVTDGDNIISFG